MALEDLIREAAAKGLTHLSLHPVHSDDNKTVYWRASATPSTMHKYVQTSNLDPAEAVRVVLEALPRASKRSAPKGRFDKENPPLSEMAKRAAEDQGVGETHREAVTAAVNPGDPVDLHDGPNDEWERFKV